MSREQLGDLIHLDKAAVGRMERGERMNFDNLGPVAEALGIHVRSLFDFDMPEPQSRLNTEAIRIARLVAHRARRDPSFPKRVLKILREL